MQEQIEAGAPISPLMRQYWDIKAENPEALLFFRVGDFYELFDTDAQVAARELDITLTGRPEPSYPGGRVPMAGVPVRAVDVYLARLVAKGYCVAICEQIGVVGAEKGPVERRVARILTPGTVLESHLLPPRQNNYLLSLVRGGDLWGMACVDASCGEFFVTQLAEDQLLLEIGRIEPKEILVAKRVVKPGANDVMPREVLDVPGGLVGNYRFTGRPAMFFQLEPAQRRIFETFGVTTLEGFGCQAMPLAVAAAGAALEYLERTQANQMPRFAGISTYLMDGHLTLDGHTRRNLELTETSRDRSFDGSLLWSLDRTRSGMGSRMLRKWLLKPLYSVSQITQRQDAVQELMTDVTRRTQLGDALAKLSDVERLAVKLTSATVVPRDLLAISLSVAALAPISKAVAGSGNSYLQALNAVPEKLAQLGMEIQKAIKDDAGRELMDGGIFADGYSTEIDEIRSLLGGGKQWIEDYQKLEQQRSGIRSLKVNFNRTFGYYIEVTNSNKESVPQEYIRKQTLTNAERFITPELKEYEAKILNAEKNQNDVEYKMFLDFRQQLVGFGVELLEYATRLANLDALLSLAEVACERNYCRPQVDNSTTLDIKQGRHPVLEKILPMGRYVANDTHLEGDSENHQLIILTGPNMSGKSSLLRQVAHIVILAQIGSYVPAQQAHVGLVDRIFTRIGAVDDLTQGQSTFLVEMAETTQCCLSATPKSLILLDEVGRGTSTYDGVAIAWAVAEHLATDVRARTIFATHYHELNGLSAFFPQIENYQVLVKELDGEVQFIRAVVPGGASRSYGVQVAKMAGLPATVIDRARYLMGQMEKRGAAGKILDGPKFRNISLDEVMQLSLFESGAQPVTGSAVNDVGVPTR